MELVEVVYAAFVNTTLMPFQLITYRPPSLVCFLCSCHTSLCPFTAISFENQRNAVTNVIAIFAPYIAHSYIFAQVALLKIVPGLMLGLYIELTYRVSMRWHSMTHHFYTIFAIAVAQCAVLYKASGLDGDRSNLATSE
ncbi:hypothetical protein F5050DRAFT_186535 [Lentinula boryana]|uniref:Uncharacterized protein n=1 Tax=Lentinula boryana TaxID=40481 RepID=A0ABQ8QBT8_9AGAR|nr:hypothetical protein F5050DRAFT_186535 [Lentinula boryana]